MDDAEHRCLLRPRPVGSRSASFCLRLRVPGPGAASSLSVGYACRHEHGAALCRPARTGFMRTPNNCTQATPVYGSREFLAQVPGAPGAERLAQMKIVRRNCISITAIGGMMLVVPHDPSSDMVPFPAVGLAIKVIADRMFSPPCWSKSSPHGALCICLHFNGAISSRSA